MNQILAQMFVVSYCLVFTTTAHAQEILCLGDGEFHTFCGPICEPTCENPKPQNCSSQCLEGCFCSVDLVRGPGHICIPPAQCPLV
ncbi:chymotrypsin-elastase inhibitor ixodidin-like [Tachypleus tridentatus]|uniref:chymotrypsin-elastase inhibitor ixodidin-like n=1 Tax=Tachypleus tridentatus TaxID=6853 RepID=UPI003FD3B8DB